MKNYINNMRLLSIDIGFIVEKNKKFYILIENFILDKENRKIVEILSENERKKYVYLDKKESSKLKYTVYEKFLVAYSGKRERRQRIDIKNEKNIYSIILQIPYFFSNAEKIKIDYDGILKEVYIELIKNKYYYRIYSFMNSEYSIFKNKDHHKKYRYVEGNYFFEKTKLSLNCFTNKNLIIL